MGDQQRFAELFRASGLSQRDLSQLSGVSEATISRALNGGNCQTDTLITLLAALDGAPQAVKQDNATPQCGRCYAALQQLIAEKDRSRNEQIGELQAHIRSLKRLAASLGALLAVLFAGVVAVLIIDALHGGIGWIRYQSSYTAHSILTRLMMGLVGIKG